MNGGDTANTKQHEYNMNQQPVIIIGAGWAGLAAAVELTQKGHQVIVYEAAKQAGGRARAVPYKNETVDNGQHIFVGAYRETLKLMKAVGIDIHSALIRLPLSLTTIDKSKAELRLKAPPLPAPLHLLFALLFAKGLNFKQRRAAIRFGLTLRKYNYHLREDISLEALLMKTRQPGVLTWQLWEPLCLAILNTPIHEASANIFMQVFKDAFTKKRQDADLLLPTSDLSQLFPDAAIQYIKNNGGEIHYQTRIESIEITNQQISGVSTKAGLIKTSQLILASAPQNVNKILPDHPHLAALKNNIEHFQYEPIVTVYLQYPENIRLPQMMLGMSSTLSQWVFDRGQLCQQPGLFSVVISSHGEHMSMDDDKLTQVIHAEISSLLETKPELVNSFIIREKRATFACVVNINSIRPGNETGISGLYLAGDYTDTQYPATLEGAVRSGLSAAKYCLKSLNK